LIFDDWFNKMIIVEGECYILNDGIELNIILIWLRFIFTQSIIDHIIK
jgi:hypothetical protein